MWLKRGLIFTLFYFVSVIFAMLFADLTFGYGLGDLFYLYLQIAWIIVLLITFKSISTREKQIGQTLTTLILMILISSIIYISTEFTVNRGGLYPWNGRIFMESFKTIQENKEKAIKYKLDSLTTNIRNDSKDKVSLKERGQIYYDNNEFKLSKIDFDKALQIDSNYYDALIGLGDIYCQESDYRKALQLLEKAYLVDSIKDESLKVRIKNIREK